MKVYDVVSMCEYVGCDIVDFWGFEIPYTKENCNEIYEKSVEHLEARDNRILIFTFDNMDNWKQFFDNNNRGI